MVKNGYLSAIDLLSYLFLLCIFNVIVIKAFALNERCIEGRVSAYVKIDVTLIGVFHPVDYSDGVSLDLIGNCQLELIWVLSECLLILGENKGKAVGGLLLESKNTVTGKAVIALHFVGLAVCHVSPVFRRADKRKENRCIPFPSLAALPEVFPALIAKRVKLCAVFVCRDLHFSEFKFINHCDFLLRFYFSIPYLS